MFPATAHYLPHAPRDALCGPFNVVAMGGLVNCVSCRWPIKTAVESWQVFPPLCHSLFLPVPWKGQVFFLLTTWHHQIDLFPPLETLLFAILAVNELGERAASLFLLSRWIDSSTAQGEGELRQASPLFISVKTQSSYQRKIRDFKWPESVLSNTLIACLFREIQSEGPQMNSCLLALTHSVRPCIVPVPAQEVSPPRHPSTCSYSIFLSWRCFGSCLHLVLWGWAQAWSGLFKL